MPDGHNKNAPRPAATGRGANSKTEENYMRHSYFTDDDPVKRQRGRVLVFIQIRGGRFRLSGTLEHVMKELRRRCPGGKLMELAGDAGGERAA